MRSQQRVLNLEPMNKWIEENAPRGAFKMAEKLGISIVLLKTTRASKGKTYPDSVSFHSRYADFFNLGLDQVLVKPAKGLGKRKRQRK